MGSPLKPQLGEMTMEDFLEDDQIGDEQLTAKDKIINISNKR